MKMWDESERRMQARPIPRRRFEDSEQGKAAWSQYEADMRSVNRMMRVRMLLWFVIVIAAMAVAVLIAMEGM